MAVTASLKAFGVEAAIEYRHLKTPQDWGAAWGAAWDAARGAADVLSSFTPTYKLNKPFVTLIDIYEMGLYPIGVVDGKFVVYVPPCSMDFPEELQ